MIKQPPISSSTVLKRTWIFSFSFFLSTCWAGSFDDYFRSLRSDQISPILELQLRHFDLNTKDEKGTPALVLALANDSFKVAEYLIQQRELNLDATNPNGENALMMAALKGQLSLAQALLKRGAEVNKPGWTPLHYAAASAAPESEKMVQLLLDHYAYIDAASPNQSTPLMMAARYGSSKGVQLLLNEGADATLRNDKGMTALDFANSVSRKDVASLISQHLNQQAPVAAQPEPAATPVPAAESDTTLPPETTPVAAPAVQEVPLDAKPMDAPTSSGTPDQPSQVEPAIKTQPSGW